VPFTALLLHPVPAVTLIFPSCVTLTNGDARTAAWGYCNKDYAHAAILSPYPFKTAKEHYEALGRAAADSFEFK